MYASSVVNYVSKLNRKSFLHGMNSRDVWDDLTYVSAQVDSLVQSSEVFLAEVSPRSPRKLFILYYL